VCQFFCVNDQHGAIPVALTIQQLENALLFALARSAVISGIELSPKTAAINKCEADILLLTRITNGSLQMVVGECKSEGGEISEHDVANLTLVANIIPWDQIQVYIVFSKTGYFTPEEIARCEKAQSSNRLRVILLSRRELEPMFVYQQAAQEFDIKEIAISLEALARGTQDIYFQPKRRNLATQ